MSTRRRAALAYHAVIRYRAMVCCHQDRMARRAMRWNQYLPASPPRIRRDLSPHRDR